MAKKIAKPSEKVLVIRTSAADGTSYNTVKGPAAGPGECPEWDPAPTCGHGLHGLVWGDGNWSYLSNEIDALWQVVEVDDLIVTIDSEKVKFPRGVVVYSGDMPGAVKMVLANEERILATVKSIQEESKTKSQGGRSKKTAASSGYSSTAASSGYSSKAASSGYYSNAASSGDSSKAASSGDSSKAASSGNSSKAASSGDYSTAASSGNSSKAASSGDYSTAQAKGKDTIAMVAGREGAASGGENGCFALAWYDEKAKRNRIVTGYVGEDGIKAATLYRVNKKGALEEVR